MDFRIGVIGAGTHGARYVRHASEDVPGLKVTALCRRQTQPGLDLARRFGCRHLTDASELISSPDVDGVVVCTPPSSHFRYARETLAAGKPLLLEKPMTGTLAEAEQLTALAGPLPAMVAQSLRWNPVIRQVAQLWSRLGKVHLIRLAQRLEPTDLPWQKDKAETVGGSVLLTGVHLFDLVRFLSRQEFASLDSQQEVILNPVVEDFFLARGRLADGCWVSLEVSKFTASRSCRLEVVGEQGQLSANYLVGGITLQQGSETTRWETSARVPTLPAMLTDWLAGIRQKEPCPVTLADGLATMRLVEACYRSAHQGRTIPL